MSLRHILLGMLGSPATGYDLKQDFESGAAHYWAADLAQIYPTLKKMEAAGWVRSEEAPPVKGPKRKVYHRTKEGRAELCDWIRSGPTVGTQRAPWAAQLEFAHLTNDLAVTADLIAGIRAHFEPLHDLLVQVADELANPQTDEEFHELLAVQLGVQTNRGRLDWCDQAEQLLAGRVKETVT